MDWKLIDDTHTDFRIYWIYNDVSGGPADQFQAAANTFGTSNQLFTIPVRFQVLGNPPSGAYEQFAMAVSSGIGQVMNTGVYGDTYLTYPTIPPTTEETYDNNYNFANAPQNIKHFYFVNRQVSTEAKLFSYTINSNVSMSPSTQIQSAANDPSSGYWLTTSNAQPLSPADWNEDVAVKLVMENKGNETVTNIGLYDIIPSNGYRPFGSAQYESTGDIDFIGIKGLPGTALVY